MKTKNEIQNEIKNEIDAALAHIETLAKVARFENVDFDKTGREIINAADHLKYLACKLTYATETRKNGKVVVS